MEGIELKRKRQFMLLSQAELAEILDVKPNTVSRWETGLLTVPKTVELAMETLERKFQEKAKNDETLKENPAVGLEREN